MIFGYVLIIRQLAPSIIHPSPEDIVSYVPARRFVRDPVIVFVHAVGVLRYAICHPLPFQAASRHTDEELVCSIRAVFNLKIDVAHF